MSTDNPSEKVVAPNAGSDTSEREITGKNLISDSGAEASPKVGQLESAVHGAAAEAVNEVFKQMMTAGTKEFVGLLTGKNAANDYKNGLEAVTVSKDATGNSVGVRPDATVSNITKLSDLNSGFGSVLVARMDRSSTQMKNAGTMDSFAMT